MLQDVYEKIYSWGVQRIMNHSLTSLQTESTKQLIEWSLSYEV